MNDEKKTPPPDEVLINAAKTTLDNSLAQLDDDVRQRLRQARQSAVRAAKNTTRHPVKQALRPAWWAAAGSFALLVLVSSVVFYQYRSSQNPSPMASIEDLPLLTAPEELEMFEELDFYQWLAEEQDRVG